MKSFKDWMLSLGEEPYSTKEFFEMQNGWDDAEQHIYFGGIIRFIKGIGPYANAWNAYMNEKQKEIS